MGRKRCPEPPNPLPARPRERARRSPPPGRGSGHSINRRASAAPKGLPRFWRPSPSPLRGRRRSVERRECTPGQTPAGHGNLIQRGFSRCSPSRARFALSVTCSRWRAGRGPRAVRTADRPAPSHKRIRAEHRRIRRWIREWFDGRLRLFAVPPAPPDEQCRTEPEPERGEPERALGRRANSPARRPTRHSNPDCRRQRRATEAKARLADGDRWDRWPQPVHDSAYDISTGSRAGTRKIEAPHSTSAETRRSRGSRRTSAPIAARASTRASWAPRQ